MMKLSKN